jgi:hypothetical protein
MLLFWPSAVLGYGFCYFIGFIVAYYLFLKRQNKIDIGLLCLATVLVILHLISIVIGSSYWSLDLGNILTLIIALLFTSSIPFKESAIRYTKLLYFISCFSLITFVLNIFLPSFFSFFPEIDATVRAVNVFFSIIPLGMETYIRNFGAWGEPGMYGVYLFVAFLLELFYFKANSPKFLLLFTISVITTFSTATYISCIILYFVFLWNSQSIKRKYKIAILCVSVLLLFAIVAYSLTGGGNSYVFAKLLETDSDSGTTFERIRAVQTAISLIVSYFPFGCGWGVYSDYLLNEETILTATPLNWFAIYGVLYGIIMNIGIFLCAKRISNTLMQALGIMLAIFACIISQEVSSVLISIIPIFYAFKLSRPQQLINDEN